LRSGRILPWRRRCPRHIHLPAVRRLPFVRMWKAFCRTLPLPPRIPTVTPPPAATAQKYSFGAAQCRSVPLQKRHREFHQTARKRWNSLCFCDFGIF
jgi:hypothetical protein